jgi:hypothetical protein
MKILARFNFVVFFISVKEADSYKYSPSRLTLHAYNFLRTTTEDKRHTNVFIMYTMYLVRKVLRIPYLFFQ